MCNADVVEPAGEQVVIVSSDPGDTLLGTGVQKVMLCYYDTAWKYIEEIIEMNGTTGVQSAGTNIYRIEQLLAFQTGSNGKAVGTITVKNIAGTSLYAQIDAGFRQMKRAIHYIPPNSACEIHNVVVGSSTVSGTVFQIVYTDDNTDHGGGLVERTHIEFEMSRSSLVYNTSLPVIESKSNGLSVGIRAMGIAPNQSASGSFCFEEVHRVND